MTPSPSAARLNVPDVLKDVIPSFTTDAVEELAVKDIYHKLYEEIKAVAREKVIQKLPNWLVKFTLKQGAHANLFDEILPSLIQHVRSSVPLISGASYYCRGLPRLGSAKSRTNEVKSLERGICSMRNL